MKKLALISFSVSLVLLFLILSRPSSNVSLSLSSITSILNQFDEVNLGDNLSELSFALEGSPTSAPYVTGISWPIYHEEPGLVIYKEEGQPHNYLFVIDPVQKVVSVQNGWGRLADQWEKATNPVCVFNGTYYEPGDGMPTFPLIINNEIIPGFKTSNPNYEVRILYVNGGILTVENISSNDEIKPAESAIAGLKPSSANVGVTNHTVISVKDNLLYVSITQDRSAPKVSEMLIGFGIPEQNIIAFDAGLSSAARCYGEDLFVRDRIFANALIISNP